MKNTLALIFMMATLHISACDICGCSSSGYGLGLLPGSPQHFVGLGYKYRAFETTHLTLFDNEVPTKSREFYQTMEVWGRYVPHKRIQLFGYLPYQVMNQQGEYNAQISGIGDAIVSGFWSVPIQNDSLCVNVSRRLLVGASSKLPTGKNDYSSVEGEVFNENLQPGSGSWDFIYHLNYTEIRNKWGFLAEMAYRRNSQNDNYYRYGHRFSTNLRVFGRIKGKSEDFMILPFVGAFFEDAGHDFDGHSYNEYSGGTMLMTQTGIDVVKKHLGVRTTYSIPTYQHLGSNQIHSRAQFAASILYLF